MPVDIQLDQSRLAADLRTVLVLLTGTRPDLEQCERQVQRVFAGRADSIDEAVVYLLGTHLLALTERQRLDRLAWRWLSQRDGPGVWSPQSAAEALRLAIFAVESGWEQADLGRLLSLTLESRRVGPWVDLDALARTGGRHARVLKPVVCTPSVLDPVGPCRRAAVYLLSRCADLPSFQVSRGAGWVVVADRSGRDTPDALAVVVFTWGASIPEVAWSAIGRVQAEGPASSIAQVYGPRVRRIQPPVPRSSVIHLDRRAPTLRALSHLDTLRSTGRGQTYANQPSGVSLPCSAVWSVFGSGPSVCREGRWWVSEGVACRAR
ncbi:MAG: hypothetical protein AB8H79_08000 [Myxococcota bacterium]